MAAQSGISPTPELESEWAAFQSSKEQSVLKISIKDERLVPNGSSTAASDMLETVFDLFKREEGLAEPSNPAYFIVKLPSPTSADSAPWPYLFISYVPDAAPVRSKMLYASTRQTLVRSLGDSKFKDSLFATSKDDLTYDSYVAHTRHTTASAPLTAREQEMAAIRAAESAAADTANDAPGGGRSMIFGAHDDGRGEGEQGGSKVRGALPWSDAAVEAVKSLKEEGGKDFVQLEIDLKSESIVLSDDQPSSLSVPVDRPCYLFYRHAAGIVLIYSCPPSSPVKPRLVYSSAVLVFYKYAAKEFAGIDILKKLETADPTEVTPSWIDSELGPLANPSQPASASTDGSAAGTDRSGVGSGASTPVGTAPMPKEEKAFARPSRPGRRR
ncbi:hypothetical protein JCM10212_003119 [Sporobolomyces blumeae]